MCVRTDPFGVLVLLILVVIPLSQIKSIWSVPEGMRLAFYIRIG